MVRFKISSNIMNIILLLVTSGGSKGAQQARARPLLKLDQLCLINQIFIRMLKNKAQITRESSKTTLELPGPLSGPWTPAESKFVLAHNAPPPPPPVMKILDPPLVTLINFSILK